MTSRPTVSFRTTINSHLFTRTTDASQCVNSQPMCIAVHATARMFVIDHSNASVCQVYRMVTEPSYLSIRDICKSSVTRIAQCVPSLFSDNTFGTALIVLCSYQRAPTGNFTVSYLWGIQTQKAVQRLHAATRSIQNCHGTRRDKARSERSCRTTQRFAVAQAFIRRPVELIAI